eukprot:1674690-Prymnesium_polylepis.3
MPQAHLEARVARVNPSHKLRVQVQGVTGGIGRTSGRGKGRGVVEQQNMRLDLQVGLPPADPDSIVSDRDEEICRARCESICCGTAD